MRSGRADAVAAAILNRVGGRATSLDTLKACLDPFHDTEIDPQGWPDLTTSPSVVQVYKASLTITAPSGVGSSNWDCHIWNSPYFSIGAPVGGLNVPPTASTLTYVQNSAGNNVGFATYSSNGNAQYAPVGLNVTTFLTGSPPTSFVNFPASSTATMQSLQVPQTLSKGASRVFASGIEVHNTTPQLYRGGSVLVYRQPLDDNAYHSTVNVYQNASSTSWSAVDVLPVPEPPNSLAVALQLKGSKQWGAEDGVYQVHGLHSTNLPTNGNTYVVPSYWHDDPETGSTDYTPTMQLVSATLEGVAANQTFWTEFDTSGCWFTGLAPQTILTLNWNVYIERFPSQLNTDLVLLAKQSPEYDVMGMELISAVGRTMPVATFVNNNDLGSWFSDILSTGAEYVAPLLQAMPHPIAKGIGTALSAGSTMMKGWNKKPAAERAAINKKTKAAVQSMAARANNSSKQNKRINPGPKQAVSTWVSKGKGKKTKGGRMAGLQLPRFA